MRKSHYSETAYGRMRDRKKQHEVYSRKATGTTTETRISRVPYKTIMAFH